jgi:arylsulfatase A-like enzyme
MNILFPSILTGFFIAVIFGLESIFDGYGDGRLVVYYLIVFIPAFGVLSLILYLYGKWRKFTPTILNKIFLLCVALISFFILLFLFYTSKQYLISVSFFGSRFFIFSFSLSLSLLFFWGVSSLHRKTYKYFIIALTTFSLAAWLFISLNLEFGFIEKKYATQEGPNILLLTVESLRYDYLGCNGNKEIKTPHIDALAEKGIVFDNYFVQAPYTTSSFSTLLTGLYPFKHKAILFGEKPLPQYHPFIEELNQKGYLVEIDAPYFSELFPDNTCYNRDAIFNKNIPFYKNIYNNLALIQSAINERLGTYMSSLSGQYCFGQITSMKRTTKLLRRLRLNRDENWFFWSHFVNNCHWPYSAPPHFLKMYSKGHSFLKTSYCEEDLEFFNKNPHSITDNVRKEIKAIYSAEVSCMDKQIGIIINSLKRLNLLKKTVIIISTDHGELLGEYNHFGHSRFVKDQLIRVPLIIYLPGYRESGKRIRDFVEEVDIAPTVLDICRVDSTQTFDGRSFLSLLNGKGWQKNAVYSSVVYKGKTFRCSYRTKEYKIVWDGEKDDLALYNIIIDPDEKVNLANKVPEVTRKLKKELLVFTGCNSLYDLKQTTEDIKDENMREAMRALGYVK